MKKKKKIPRLFEENYPLLCIWAYLVAFHRQHLAGHFLKFV